MTLINSQMFIDKE